MGRAKVEEIECKSALNRVEGMSFGWSLNPYRGCEHGCAYCFARSTHHYFELGVGDDFSGILFAKINVAKMLTREIGRRTWRRDSVAIGTATDPYQPIEGTYKLTRECLSVLARYRTPTSIVTKGTLIVRDLDVLGDLAERAGVTVCHSIPTVDESIWRRSEPGTPPPWQRLKAMARLRSHGIKAGVLMAPLLPGLSALPEQMERTATAAAANGAAFLGAGTLHLGPAVREHFLTFLDREFPELSAEYGRLYPGKYAPKVYTHDVEAMVGRLRDTYALHERGMVYRAPAAVPAQLALGI